MNDNSLTFALKNKFCILPKIKIGLFIMGRYILFCLVFVSLLSLMSSQVFAQSAADTTELKASIQHFSELEFQAALVNYVEELLASYGEEALPQEKFLISLMRLVNNEMRGRIKNQRVAIEKYFNDLKNELDELKALKGRLKTAGISELDSYINELEARMRLTIKAGEVDYKKKKVFEDALQLLYVAEEMIKMDQLREPGTLNKRISKSKDMLLNAFGEVGNTDDVKLDFEPTIFNLFEEWSKTESYKYNARLIDVKIARSNLLKAGTIETVQRMFNNQLKYAYTAFNYFEYDLSDRLLEDLVDAYSSVGVRDFEDIYYYWAESNFALQRFLRAQEIYQHLLEAYPNTVYLSRTYGRLIEIAYKLNQPQEAAKYYSKYQNVASPSDAEYYDIQFAAALSYYDLSDFNRAVEILLSFPKSNPYYYFAQYLVGTIYAAGQNYDLAYEVFETMANSESTPFDFYCKSLYKLSLITYERGGYLTSIQYASLIPETYARYDKVLNVLAWSSFMVQQLSTAAPEDRDYTQAKYFAHRLLEEFYGSEHRMEAEGLLAYIYQLEEKPTLAVNLYQNAYESKTKKKDIVNYLEEKDSLRILYDQAKTFEETALRKNDRNAYVKASSVANNLQETVVDLDLAEISPIGAAVSREIMEILDQLDQMNQLKARAKEEGNNLAIAKIDSMMLRMTAVLDMFPDKYLQTAIAYNWFDAYPVAQKVADYEIQTTKKKQIRENILNEMALIDSRMINLQTEVERAKLKGDYATVVSIEQKIQKLVEIRKRYDRLYAQAAELTPGEEYAEFNQWGDFGAFGIIDVNFGERDRLQRKMADVSTLYNSVMDRLAERREVVEDKMKKIEAEIRFMTMKARLQERQRLRAEREQSFRETYFDQRTSEFEER